MSFNLFEKPIHKIYSLLKNKEIKYTELLNTVIVNIHKFEKSINAYLTLRIDQAFKQAKLLDKEGISSKNLLFGIPISVKDSFTTNGVKTTAGSKMLENFVPSYNATSYERLVNNGTILLGKTNMDEFAHGFTTEYSAFKITRNPWNLSNAPGGSSGGSAASIACRESFLSLASENYGSIIQPSSLCGVCGMKPTYGRSSRFGIIAMASSLECPGIIGRCIEDVAVGIEAISGFDSYDATSVQYPKENYFQRLNKKIKNTKIAIIKPLMKLMDKELSLTIESSIKVFNSLGVKSDYIDWYDLDLDGQIYDILYRSEVSSNLARYDGIRYGYKDTSSFSDIRKYYQATRSKFGKHVKRQIMTDPITLSKDRHIYQVTLQLRRRQRDFIDTIFDKYSAVLTPASAAIELKLGTIENNKWRQNNRKLGKINSVIACPPVLYGYPAITFPVGFSASKAPVGIQLFGARFSEQKLFNLAYAYQEETNIKFLKPKNIN